MDKIDYSSKSGQKKFYGIMLVLIIVALVLLNRFFPGNSEEANSLQPVREYIGSASGSPIEIYTGTISKISAKSITLSNNAKSKDFSISEEHTAKFVNANDQPIEPNIGDNAVQLFLVETPLKEKYVTMVVIDAP